MNVSADFANPLFRSVYRFNLGFRFYKVLIIVVSECVAAFDKSLVFDCRKHEHRVRTHIDGFQNFKRKVSHDTLYIRNFNSDTRRLKIDSVKLIDTPSRLHAESFYRFKIRFRRKNRNDAFSALLYQIVREIPFVYRI